MFPLSHMLKSFVRVGTLKVVDAEGNVHVFAGSAGAQGHHAAHGSLALSQAVLQSGAARGRSLYGRPHELRGARRCATSTLFSMNRLDARHLSACRRCCVASRARAQALPAGKSGRQGAEERRASLRSRQRLLQAVPRRGHAVFMRLFPRRRRHARAGAAEQASADRRQAPSEAGPARSSISAAAGAISRSICGAWRTWTSPASRCQRSSMRSPMRRRGVPDLSDRVRFELRDYRNVDRTLRPHRLGRHVRACRRAVIMASSSQRSMRCSRTTASCCCTRSAT